MVAVAPARRCPTGRRRWRHRRPGRSRRRRRLGGGRRCGCRRCIPAVAELGIGVIAAAALEEHVPARVQAVVAAVVAVAASSRRCPTGIGVEVAAALEGHVAARIDGDRAAEVAGQGRGRGGIGAAVADLDKGIVVCAAGGRDILADRDRDRRRSRCRPRLGPRRESPTGHRRCRSPPPCEHQVARLHARQAEAAARGHARRLVTRAHNHRAGGRLADQQVQPARPLAGPSCWIVPLITTLRARIQGQRVAGRPGDDRAFAARGSRPAR